MILRKLARWRFAVLTFAAMIPTGAHSQENGRVSIAGFAIDETEVTIAQFQAYTDAKGIRTLAEAAGGGFERGAGWEQRPGWTFKQPYGEQPNSQNEPAVHISWDEARGYCEWRGGRLPTAAEWRLAAFTENRPQPPNEYRRGQVYPYPVGEASDGMNLRSDDGWPQHAPAGSTKRGVNGLFDMGGNIWEWLSDRRGEEALIENEGMLPERASFLR